MNARITQGGPALSDACVNFQRQARTITANGTTQGLNMRFKRKSTQHMTPSFEDLVVEGQGEGKKEEYVPT